MISRLGRFEIQSEIGRGGFGQVFHALDPLMNRVVAVKVLTASEDAGSFNRFKNEATAAGNLHHENIVTVYEFGQEGPVPFLVMEYLNGEDLHNVIRRQTPLSLYQKVRIMDQVADGLHCAHSNGVLHRDVKPANIMLLKDGSVKIMDFGIARLVRDTSTRLTQQGYLIGTVVYMAPELFAGELEVDALCDIWSYGVVMYELLAGKNPFQTGSLQSEMYRIVNHDPAPLPPGTCPPELQAVIGKLLTRQRQFRYQTLEDTRFDLQPILQNLKKVEADRLVSHAQELMFQERWVEALEPAREARKMDPQNGTARIIFERVQDQLRKQSVRPRIDDLVRRGNEAAGQRKFQEAISHLEAATKLDPNNEKVLFRLQELRSLKAKHEESVSLVNQAGERFRAGRLTEAVQQASDAVTLDPENEEGRQLFESIQNALRVREAESALEADLLRVRGLMAIDELDAAMASLKTAASNYPGHTGVRDLTAQVASRIAERDRRRELLRRLEQAKAAVRAGRFDEAIKELEQLQGTSAQPGEVADLLAYARQELKAKGKSDELKRISEAAAELNRKQDFCEAIRILEDALKRYPDDLSLTRLLRSTYTELQNQERETALRAGLQQCEALRRAGKFQEALNLIARLISDNPNHRELTDLGAKIRQDKNQAARTTAVRTAVEEAKRLLGEGQAEAAVNVLEAAGREAGPEAELKELLKKAEAARQGERDRQYIESELKHAKVFEDRGDVSTSLKIIDGALRRFPKSPELLAARQRLDPAGVKEQQPEPKVVAPPSVAAVLPDRKEPAQNRQKADDATTVFQASNVPSRREEPAVSVAAVPQQVEAPAAKSKGQLYAIAGIGLALLVGLALWMMRPSTIGVSPEKLTFESKPGASPAAQTITVTGSSDVAIPQKDAAWITVTRGAHGSGKTEFQIQVSPDKLSPGDHTGLLTFASDKKVKVDLVVALGGPDSQRGPQIQPASLMFPYTASGAPAQKIVVTSSAPIVDPKPSEPWVSFTRRNLTAGKTEFLVQVAGNGLAPGQHSAFLTFPAGRKVPIELIIPGGTTTSLYPSLLAFPAGGAQQRVTFIGPGEIPDPTPSEPWLTVTRGNVSAGKAEFLVQTAAAELDAGKYDAFLTFPGDKKVRVELTVTEEPGTLEIKPESLTIASGGSPQTITVTGSGEIPNPTATDRWLKFTRRDLGAGIAEFEVQPSPAGLVAGPHVAYLNFPSKKVRVVFNVTPGNPQSR